jgi:acetyl-CoA carboxylase carboxyltransferase component
LRGDYEQLKSKTAADGIITGTGCINSGLVAQAKTRAAVVVNDYSVLAGTQGYYHHQKLDRILAIADEQQLPVVMFTEGGGGRPGDTDITTVNSGLQCGSFAAWAKLSGEVPRIAVANGYCFAGNAALFGSADITIATRQSWIGMAGPAMIEGGGLGQFAPTDIGPIEVQAANGVVDIVADDEAHATALAKQCLSYFQGPLLTASHPCPDQQTLRELLPSDRRYVYDIRAIINTLADDSSFTELKAGFGGAIVTGFIRLQGQPIGLLASDCRVLGGAIDVDAAEKAADFINLCNQFGIALVSLCDTPGFMVGPEHEQRGAARRLVKMFSAGAQLRVPLVAVVLRKCYGLGAQALLGGSTHSPDYTVAWPTGEFGPMGLEGAVKLGFKRELETAAEGQARQQLYTQLLASQYQRGQAIEVASLLEIDAVIDPADTRATLINALKL